MSNPRWLGLTCLLDPSRLGLACVLNPTILDLAWLSTPRYLGLGWFNWKERKYYFNKKITWTLDNLMIQGLTTMIKDFVTPIKLRISSLIGLVKTFLAIFQTENFLKHLSRPDSRIHDRHIGKVPLQGVIPMRTQTYIQTYLLNNSIRVRRKSNKKTNFMI
jgi:hypothetical protein